MMEIKPEDMVIICWHNTGTGEEGEGTMAIPKNIAEKLIREMEREYPYMRHWIRGYECPNS